LERDRDNVRAALRWAIAHEAETALRLGAALWWFWNTRGSWREARDWLEGALRSPGGQRPAPARGRALLALGDFATHQGDLAAGRAYLAEALDLLREQGDETGVAFALMVLGVERLMGDDAPAARALLDESVAAFRRLGYIPGEAAALGHLGDLMLRADDLPGAGRSFEAAIALLREHGDHWTLAARLADFGDVARLSGDDARAKALYEESASLFRAIGLEHGVPSLAHNLGYVALHQGELERATRLFRWALDVYDHDWGDEHGVAECLIGLAAVAVAADQPARAARWYGAADAIFERLGRSVWPGNRGEYERHLAAARATLGEAAFATAYAEGRAMTRDDAATDARVAGPAPGATRRPRQAGSPRE